MCIRDRSTKKRKSRATVGLDVLRDARQHHGPIVLHAGGTGDGAFSEGWSQRTRSENIFRFDVHLHLHVEIRKHLRRELQSQTSRFIVDDRETAARESSLTIYRRSGLHPK